MTNLVQDNRTARSDTRWLVPPFFMLRFAGLPIDSVTPLTSPRTVAWAHETLDLEAELSASRTAVADALEAVVSTLPSDLARRRILEIRRDVFNLRLPRHNDGDVALTGSLGAVAGPLLTDWLARRQRLADRLHDGEAVLSAELEVGRRHLRVLARHPHLRHGLLLASPSLDRHMSTYLDATDGPLGKRARRIERSLLEYVYRTACKTSPFSTFTAVQVGQLRPGGGDLIDVGEIDRRWRGYVQLNLAAVAPIVEQVLTSPDIRDDLPVRITSGWRHDRDRIRYVRRQQTMGAADAPVAMGMVRESLFFLTSGEVLGRVLAALPDELAGDDLRFGELVERLHRGAPDRLPRAEVEAYVDHLLRLGLLTVPALHIDIHHPNPVADLAHRLRTLDRDWATGLAERLDAVVAHLSAYPDADLPRRRLLLDAARTDLADAQHDLGRDEATTPRTLVYEDVTLGTAVSGDEDRWRADVLPDLEGFARILPVFDMVLPQRLVSRGFFRARFGPGGRCGDVLRFVHEFHQDFYEQFLRATMRRREFDDDGEYQPQPNWLKLPDLDALDDARREVVAQMRARFSGRADDRAELVLDDDFIEAVASRLPDLPGDLEPRCFFLQLDTGGGRAPLAVLNRAYSGLTLMFSRFAHCFPGSDGVDLGAGLRAAIAAAQPPGAVFAELTGGYETTNLNLHPAVTPYELVCPGDVSFRPHHEQIAVGDLDIVDDESTGQLVLHSRQLGVRVIPVYLGFLLPMALPDLQRLLLNFSCTSMARIDLWSGTDKPLGGAAVGGHPRVRYGSLVVQRELWKADVRRLPRREGRTEAEWVREWVRWRRDHSLPARVFATVDASVRVDGGEDPGGRPAAVGNAKPQYVDFDSVLSLSLLDGLLKTATNRVVFTEMLPDHDGVWVRHNDSRYVTEVVVELDGLRWRTP